MPFTVDDFQDLLRLLEQHPRWQAELRRQLLTDELLELPALVRQLTARVDALAERVDAVAAAQARTEQQLQALTARVDALAEAQARTEQQLQALTERVDALAGNIASLTDVVGTHAGEMLELRYARRAGAYFSRIARGIRLLDPGVLADRLDEAVDQGHLTEADRDAVLEADMVLDGRRREDRAEVYLVVEVSRGIGRGDVERAAERSRVLAKLGRPAPAVVAGERISSGVEAMAARQGRTEGH